jgi:hypothetical protein
MKGKKEKRRHIFAWLGVMRVFLSLTIQEVHHLSLAKHSEAASSQVVSFSSDESNCPICNFLFLSTGLETVFFAYYEKITRLVVPCVFFSFIYPFIHRFFSRGPPVFSFKHY